MGWFFHLLGALGLFLLGMWLMTEGLKLAGGQALEHLLGRWTRDRKRGLAAGMLVTALVQSSSAVTVATIGFVNARLMDFRQSVWVIFGSNVGTTLTAWIVTLFGFNVKMDAITLPLIGVGAFMQVFAPKERGRALGMALAGFGVLFMGIDALKNNFTDIAAQLDLSLLAATGLSGIIWGFIIGLCLTVLTQSSSAAIAIILTAVASDMSGMTMAAAAVIGANIGTTSTALIATVGATAGAKRLAWAHVMFNLVTAALALLLLPVFLGLLTLLVDEAGLGGNNSVLLSAFHTAFNLFGVLLMWPLEPAMSRFLLARFTAQEQVPHPKHYLDRNIASVPDLAIRALQHELENMYQEICQQDLNHTLEGGPQTEDFTGMMADISAYISEVSRGSLTSDHSRKLTAGLSMNHYLQNSQSTLSAMAALHFELAGELATALQHWLETLNHFAVDLAHTDAEYQQQHWQQYVQDYQALKQRFLSAGVAGQIDLNSMDTALQFISLSKRHMEQLLQTTQPRLQLAAG